MADTRLYKIWQGMIERCTNPNNPNYPQYGERGITICEEWLHSFSTFYADMGEAPTGKHTVDRINNDLGYGPNNCRWATRLEQGRNTRRTHHITFNGETLTLREWAERIPINYDTLRNRLFTYGWSIERAITEPVPQRRS
jgi:hypothetical protein